jgi:hypothetical protein
MEKVKAPSLADIQSDVKWTKYYVEQIRIAKRAKDYVAAAQWANEISAIWGTISMQFDEAQK